jgi:hypothetical protein
MRSITPLEDSGDEFPHTWGGTINCPRVRRKKIERGNNCGLNLWGQTYLSYSI